MCECRMMNNDDDKQEEIKSINNDALDELRIERVKNLTEGDETISVWRFSNIIPLNRFLTKSWLILAHDGMHRLMNEWTQEESVAKWLHE